MHVLLDRDGVINRDLPQSVRSPSALVLLPEALAAFKLFKQHGVKVIIVTNQACVGRGDVSPETLDAIHQKMTREVEAHGGTVEAIFVCPHTDADACDCRKPAPGLILKAQREHGFDLASTYFVGDALRDLQAARAAGCRAALVRTGKGAKVTPPEGVSVFNTVETFAQHLVGEQGVNLD